MTKEEAKQIIATWLVSSKGTKGQRGYIEGWFDEEDIEAFRMAIEALERTSNAHPTHECVEPTHECVDLISRNKVLNLVLDVCNDVMDECETVTGICGEEVYTDVREVDAILKCNKRIRNGIRRLPSAEPEQHERTFQEIVVEYPSNSTYPEYEGKPYFSIKYVEDGRSYIGYGTYNPEVLSEYMKEYFIPSEPVINSDTLRPKGKWEEKEVFDGDRTIEQYQSARCSVCGKYHTTPYMYYFNNFNYCPECGADMSGGQE